MDRPGDARGRPNRPHPARTRIRAAAAASVALVALAWLLAATPTAAVDYGSPPPTMGAAPTSAPSSVPAVAAAPASVSLGTMTSPLGTVLTGPNGFTLYTLSSDPNNGSVCTGGCLGFWPPLLVAAGGSVSGPTGATNVFATFVRADDASTQVTVDGRAVYYFKNDTAAGQTNGEGIKGAGGVWHVALASVAPAVTPTPAVAIPPTDTVGPLSSAPTGPGPLGIIVALLFVLAASVAVRARLGSRRSPQASRSEADPGR